MRHTCFTDDGGTPNRHCDACERESAALSAIRKNVRENGVRPPSGNSLDGVADRIKHGFAYNAEYDRADVMLELRRVALPSELLRHVDALESALIGTAEHGRDERRVRECAYQLIKAVHRMLEKPNENGVRVPSGASTLRPDTAQLIESITETVIGPPMALRAFMPVCAACGLMVAYLPPTTEVTSPRALRPVSCSCGWTGFAPVATP